MTAKKTASAKKPAAKKAVAKKVAAAQKTTAVGAEAPAAQSKPTPKKAAAKKAAPKAAVAKAAKPAAKKSRGKKAAKPALSNSSTLFMDKESYKACIDGLMGQGLDREDAIETLKVGIRQANGRPVPPDLLRSSQPAPEQAPAEAELAEA